MSLLDQMGDPSAEVIAFRPERVGEGVEGKLVSRDITTSDFSDDDIPVLVLEDASGVLRGVRGYHSILRKEIEKLNPQIGDIVAIKYNGKPEGKRYEHYTVKVQRADDAPF